MNSGSTVPINLHYVLTNYMTTAEIKADVFDIHSEKAPGPNGYTSEFFKCSWDIIGNDVCGAIKEFFDYGFMRREVNPTVLSLIPKIHHPQEPGDYRPIECCGVIYKAISKVLARRLKIVYL